MSITAGGVGIGKTNPAELLDVNGTIKCTTLNATSGYLLKLLKWSLQLDMIDNQDVGQGEPDHESGSSALSL